MMVDLDALFENYLQLVVKNNPNKYPNYDALEKDILALNAKWESTPVKSLNNLSPREYVDKLANDKKLFDYVEDLIDAGIEVSDIAAFTLIKQNGAGEFLSRLCYGDSDDAVCFGAAMLSLMGGNDAEETFIDAITNPNASEKLKNHAYEFLSDGQPQVVDRILEIIPTASNEAQEVFADILSNYPDNKEIYYWLVTMFYRADNVPLFADLLGRYGNTAAIDVLNSFAEENEVNYMEFLEIRAAVERLGGECSVKKDFTDDPLYRYNKNLPLDDSTSSDNDKN